MDVLIFGATGQLGRELQETAPPTFQVRALDRAKLDLTDQRAVADCLRTERPRLVINAAAYTAVDRAESEPERAFQINATAIAHLAEIAATYSTRVIHVSTDYVFDGTRGTPYRPEDVTNPTGVYGRSKLEGERHLLTALGPQTLVFRTAWLYSRHGANFVHTMLRLMRERSEVRVVCDQVGTPTWARDLARAIWVAAARTELHGLYHWTDAGVASWYDFAVAIQEEGLQLGLLSRLIRIVPITTEEYPTPARRPAYSVLEKSSTWKDLGVTAQHWRVALRHMLEGLR